MSPFLDCQDLESWEELATEQCVLAPLLLAPQSSSNLIKIARLGSGSFAEVHLVRHQDGRKMAYKQIKASRDLNAESPHCAATIQQAQDEAKLHESLDHPNIVKFEEFCWGEELGMMLEYCSGGSLASLLQDCRAPSCMEQRRQHLLPLVRQLRHWPARLELLRQAADAVSYLHSLAGGAVLHSDLRASNLLLQIGDDGSHTLKLADFGLACKMPADAEQDGSGCVQVPSHHVTNRRWVAPEVIAHAGEDNNVLLSRATDVYSLAAVMVEVLTALPPLSPYLEAACEQRFQRIFDMEYLCNIELEDAAKEGKPHLLRFPEPSIRLPCPKGGVECAEPLRGVFEACCDVRITTDQQGQPQVAPLPEQRRPSAVKLSAALASWPDCSLSCA